MAGVNQALVHRHVGSKEELIAEAAGRDLDTADTMTTGTPCSTGPWTWARSTRATCRVS
ncbi:hypothetical protein Amsp01_058670 [Amycolatopsis sp. NBRC 101858]|uniref:hypothetical protein n=1 Tax=Amycolatopsis sp. NBRC 101858 TaxID=3032200 RepID=UPI0024A09558|nr:hypothetical protein [Amycolatopsis sp. NBRC 101858]GLY39844.1 hypothetical protein Amsp01_058670 [Amycolatopsis sp. NBRC 101858]